MEVGVGGAGGTGPRARVRAVPGPDTPQIDAFCSNPGRGFSTFDQDKFRSALGEGFGLPSGPNKNAQFTAIVETLTTNAARNPHSPMGTYLRPADASAWATITLEIVRAAHNSGGILHNLPHLKALFNVLPESIRSGRIDISTSVLEQSSGEHPKTIGINTLALLHFSQFIGDRKEFNPSVRDRLLAIAIENPADPFFEVLTALSSVPSRASGVGGDLVLTPEQERFKVLFGDIKIGNIVSSLDQAAHVLKQMFLIHQAVLPGGSITANEIEKWLQPDGDLDSKRVLEAVISSPEGVHNKTLLTCRKTALKQYIYATPAESALPEPANGHVQALFEASKATLSVAGAAPSLPIHEKVAHFMAYIGIEENLLSERPLPQALRRLSEVIAALRDKRSDGDAEFKQAILDNLVETYGLNIQSLLFPESATLDEIGTNLAVFQSGISALLGAPDAIDAVTATPVFESVSRFLTPIQAQTILKVFSIQLSEAPDDAARLIIKSKIKGLINGRLDAVRPDAISAELQVLGQGISLTHIQTVLEIPGLLPDRGYLTGLEQGNTVLLGAGVGSLGHPITTDALVDFSAWLQDTTLIEPSIKTAYLTQVVNAENDAFMTFIRPDGVNIEPINVRTLSTQSRAALHGSSNLERSISSILFRLFNGASLTGSFVHLIKTLVETEGDNAESDTDIARQLTKRLLSHVEVGEDNRLKALRDVFVEIPAGKLEDPQSVKTLAKQLIKILKTTDGNPDITLIGDQLDAVIPNDRHSLENVSMVVSELVQDGDDETLVAIAQHIVKKVYDRESSTPAGKALVLSALATELAKADNRYDRLTSILSTSIFDDIEPTKHLVTSFSAGLIRGTTSSTQLVQFFSFLAGIPAGIDKKDLVSHLLETRSEEVRLFLNLRDESVFSERILLLVDQLCRVILTVGEGADTNKIGEQLFALFPTVTQTGTITRIIALLVSDKDEALRLSVASRMTQKLIEREEGPSDAVEGRLLLLGDTFSRVSEDLRYDLLNHFLSVAVLTQDQVHTVVDQFAESIIQSDMTDLQLEGFFAFLKELPVGIDRNVLVTQLLEGKRDALRGFLGVTPEAVSLEKTATLLTQMASIFVHVGGMADTVSIAEKCLRLFNIEAEKEAIVKTIVGLINPGVPELQDAVAKNMAKHLLDVAGGPSVSDLECFGEALATVDPSDRRYDRLGAFLGLPQFEDHSDWRKTLVGKFAEGIIRDGMSIADLEGFFTFIKETPEVLDPADLVDYIMTAKTEVFRTFCSTKDTWGTLIDGLTGVFFAPADDDDDDALSPIFRPRVHNIDKIAETIYRLTGTTETIASFFNHMLTMADSRYTPIIDAVLSQELTRLEPGADGVPPTNEEQQERLVAIGQSIKSKSVLEAVLNLTCVTDEVTLVAALTQGFITKLVAIDPLPLAQFEELKSAIVLWVGMQEGILGVASSFKEIGRRLSETFGPGFKPLLFDAVWSVYEGHLADRSQLLLGYITACDYDSIPKTDAYKTGTKVTGAEQLTLAFPIPIAAGREISLSFLPAIHFLGKTLPDAAGALPADFAAIRTDFITRLSDEFSFDEDGLSDAVEKELFQVGVRMATFVADGHIGEAGEDMPGFSQTPSRMANQWVHFFQDEISFEWGMDFLGEDLTAEVDADLFDALPFALDENARKAVRTDLIRFSPFEEIVGSDAAHTPGLRQAYFDAWLTSPRAGRVRPAVADQAEVSLVDVIETNAFKFLNDTVAGGDAAAIRSALITLAKVWLQPADPAIDDDARKIRAAQFGEQLQAEHPNNAELYVVLKALTTGDVVTDPMAEDVHIAELAVAYVKRFDFASSALTHTVEALTPANRANRLTAKYDHIQVHMAMLDTLDTGAITALQGKANAFVKGLLTKTERYNWRIGPAALPELCDGPKSPARAADEKLTPEDSKRFITLLHDTYRMAERVGDTAVDRSEALIARVFGLAGELPAGRLTMPAHMTLLEQLLVLSADPIDYDADLNSVLSVSDAVVLRDAIISFRYLGAQGLSGKIWAEALNDRVKAFLNKVFTYRVNHYFSDPTAASEASKKALCDMVAVMARTKGSGAENLVEEWVQKDPAWKKADGAALTATERSEFITRLIEGDDARTPGQLPGISLEALNLMNPLPWLPGRLIEREKPLRQEALLLDFVARLDQPHQALRFTVLTRLERDANVLSLLKDPDNSIDDPYKTQHMGRFAGYTSVLKAALRLDDLTEIQLLSTLKSARTLEKIKNKLKDAGDKAVIPALATVFAEVMTQTSPEAVSRISTLTDFFIDLAKCQATGDVDLILVDAVILLNTTIRDVLNVLDGLDATEMLKSLSREIAQAVDPSTKSHDDIDAVLLFFEQLELKIEGAVLGDEGPKLKESIFEGRTQLLSTITSHALVELKRSKAGEKKVFDKGLTNAWIKTLNSNSQTFETPTDLVSQLAKALPLSEYPTLKERADHIQLLSLILTSLEHAMTNADTFVFDAISPGHLPSLRRGIGQFDFQEVIDALVVHYLGEQSPLLSASSAHTAAGVTPFGDEDFDAWGVALLFHSKPETLIPWDRVESGATAFRLAIEKAKTGIITLSKWLSASPADTVSLSLDSMKWERRANHLLVRLSQLDVQTVLREKAAEDTVGAAASASSSPRVSLTGKDRILPKLSDITTQLEARANGMVKFLRVGSGATIRVVDDPYHVAKSAADAKTQAVIEKEYPKAPFLSLSDIESVVTKRAESVSASFLLTSLVHSGTVVSEDLEMAPTRERQIGRFFTRGYVDAAPKATAYALTDTYMQRLLFQIIPIVESGSMSHEVACEMIFSGERSSAVSSAIEADPKFVYTLLKLLYLRGLHGVSPRKIRSDMDDAKQVNALGASVDMIDGKTVKDWELMVYKGMQHVCAQHKTHPSDFVAFEVLATQEAHAKKLCTALNTLVKNPDALWGDSESITSLFVPGQTPESFLNETFGFHTRLSNPRTPAQKEALRTVFFNRLAYEMGGLEALNIILGSIEHDRSVTADMKSESTIPKRETIRRVLYDTQFSHLTRGDASVSRPASVPLAQPQLKTRFNLIFNPLGVPTDLPAIKPSSFTPEVVWAQIKADLKGLGLSTQLSRMLAMQIVRFAKTYVSEADTVAERRSRLDDALTENVRKIVEQYGLDTQKSQIRDCLFKAVHSLTLIQDGDVFQRSNQDMRTDRAFSAERLRVWVTDHADMSTLQSLAFGLEGEIFSDELPELIRTEELNLFCETIMEGGQFEDCIPVRFPLTLTQSRNVIRVCRAMVRFINDHHLGATDIEKEPIKTQFTLWFNALSQIIPHKDAHLDIGSEATALSHVLSELRTRFGKAGADIRRDGALINQWCKQSESLSTQCAYTQSTEATTTKTHIQGAKNRIHLFTLRAQAKRILKDLALLRTLDVEGLPTALGVLWSSENTSSLEKTVLDVLRKVDETGTNKANMDTLSAAVGALKSAWKMAQPALCGVLKVSDPKSLDIKEQVLIHRTQKEDFDHIQSEYEKAVSSIDLDSAGAASSKTTDPVESVSFEQVFRDMVAVVTHFSPQELGALNVDIQTVLYPEEGASHRIFSHLESLKQDRVRDVASDFAIVKMILEGTGGAAADEAPWPTNLTELRMTDGNKQGLTRISEYLISQYTNVLKTQFGYTPDTLTDLPDDAQPILAQLRLWESVLSCTESCPLKGMSQSNLKAIARGIHAFEFDVTNAVDGLKRAVVWVNQLKDLHTKSALFLERMKKEGGYSPSAVSAQDQRLSTETVRELFAVLTAGDASPDRSIKFNYEKPLSSYPDSELERVENRIRKSIESIKRAAHDAVSEADLPKNPTELKLSKLERLLAKSTFSTIDSLTLEPVLERIGLNKAEIDAILRPIGTREESMRVVIRDLSAQLSASPKRPRAISAPEIHHVSIEILEKDLQQVLLEKQYRLASHGVQTRFESYKDMADLIEGLMDASSDATDERVSMINRQAILMAVQDIRVPQDWSRLSEREADVYLKDVTRVLGFCKDANLREGAYIPIIARLLDNRLSQALSVLPIVKRNMMIETLSKGIIPGKIEVDPSVEVESPSIALPVPSAPPLSVGSRSMSPTSSGSVIDLNMDTLSGLTVHFLVSHYSRAFVDRLTKERDGGKTSLFDLWVSGLTSSSLARRARTLDRIAEGGARLMSFPTFEAMTDPENTIVLDSVKRGIKSHLHAISRNAALTFRLSENRIEMNLKKDATAADVVNRIETVRAYLTDRVLPTLTLPRSTPEWDVLLSAATLDESGELRGRRQTLEQDVPTIQPNALVAAVDYDQNSAVAPSPITRHDDAFSRATRSLSSTSGRPSLFHETPRVASSAVTPVPRSGSVTSWRLGSSGPTRTNLYGAGPGLVVGMLGNSVERLSQSVVRQSPSAASSLPRASETEE